MLKKLKDEKKYLFLLFGIVSLIMLIYYLPAIITKSAYMLGTDLRMQWYEFYYEFKRLIKDFVINHELPFYSWTTFLGNNFYASKGYYLIGDIYSYIGLFLNRNFFVMAEEVAYLKYVVSAFTFYIYLTSFDRKPITKIICSIAYAISSYAVYFSEQMVFQSFYSFIPLYLLGVELYLKDNKKLLFTLSCGLLFATNYYLFYTLAALTPLYFTYRYFSLKKDGKEFVKSAFILILFFVLGSLLTSFIWLPSAIYMMGTDRVSSSIDLLHPNVVYPDFIISFFFPDNLYINRGNMFDTFTYYNREICTWASTILVVLVSQFTKIFDKTRKNLTIALYAVFGIIAFFPFFCMLLHGFTNPSFRWVFIIVIINLLVISEVLDNKELIDFSLLRKSIIVYTLLIIISFIYGYFNSWYELSFYTKQIIFLIIGIVVMIVSYFLYKKGNLKIILVAVSIEIALSCLYYSYDNIANNRMVTNESIYRTKLQYYDGGAADELNAMDEANNELNEFYRVYVDQQGVYASISYNLNILYNIKGVATYDSTLAPSFNKMNRIVLKAEERDDLDWMIDIVDYNLLNFLNTKYAITTQDYEMDLNSWELIDDEYHQWYCLYKNKNYTKFGITYDKSMSEDSYINDNNSSENLLKYVIASEEDLNKIDEYLGEANTKTLYANYKGNNLNFGFESDNDSFMIISIPYDEGWSIQVDGENVEYYNVNFGFIGLPIEKGTHDVTMYFVPNGLKQGIIISGISFIVLVVYVVLLKKKHNHTVSKNI